MFSQKDIKLFISQVRPPDEPPDGTFDDRMAFDEAMHYAEEGGHTELVKALNALKKA